MKNNDLIQVTHTFLMKNRSANCVSLNISQGANGAGNLMSLLGPSREIIATLEIDQSLEQALFDLDSPELESNRYGDSLKSSTLFKDHDNSYRYLKAINKKFKEGQIEFSINEYPSELGLAVELGLTEELLSLLNSSIDKGSGLIICNGKQAESKQILQTLYPEWSHISIQQFIQNTQMDKAFIYINDYDPISLVSIALENCPNVESRVSVAGRISCVISLIPVKKQCGACAKPTPIPIASRNTFPLFLVNTVPTSYLFSRGCERCEYRSYRGSTFLESYFSNQGQFLKGLAQNLEPEQIFKQARVVGLKIFHESGLEKMNSGITSLEQITEHIPPIEQAFTELLNSIDPLSEEKSVASHKVGKNILIVEDDNDQREILKLVFKKEGFDVFTADNGKTALDVIKTNNIQIVLSDVMMPVMNGLQLVKLLKSSEDYKNIPVLMLTASSNPDHEVKLLVEGADDYCAKNVKKKVLLTRVERLMEKFQGRSKTLSHLLT